MLIVRVLKSNVEDAASMRWRVGEQKGRVFDETDGWRAEFAEPSIGLVSWLCAEFERTLSIQATEPIPGVWTREERRLFASQWRLPIQAIDEVLSVHGLTDDILFNHQIGIGDSVHFNTHPEPILRFILEKSFAGQYVSWVRKNPGFVDLPDELLASYGRQGGFTPLLLCKWKTPEQIRGDWAHFISKIQEMFPPELLDSRLLPGPSPSSIWAPVAPLDVFCHAAMLLGFDSRVQSAESFDSHRGTEHFFRGTEFSALIVERHGAAVLWMALDSRGEILSVPLFSPRKMEDEAEVPF